jgi:hypothetical protein
MPKWRGMCACIPSNAGSLALPGVGPPSQAHHFGMNPSTPVGHQLFDMPPTVTKVVMAQDFS